MVTRQFFRKRRAFTLAEILILVGIVSILMAVAIPGFIKAREARACRENLTKINMAVDEYLLQNKLEKGTHLDISVSDLVTGGYLLREPVCPTGGKYVINDADQPTCSIGGTHSLSNQ
jgi:competence protein ComGC